jgi:hypothetical protein
MIPPVLTVVLIIDWIHWSTKRAFDNNLAFVGDVVDFQQMRFYEIVKNDYFLFMASVLLS